MLVFRNMSTERLLFLTIWKNSVKLSKTEKMREQMESGNSSDSAEKTIPDGCIGKNGSGVIR